MLTTAMAIDPKALGRRIREERQKAGLSLQQLADLSGLTKAYVVRVEGEAANPSMGVVGRIAEALDLTIADLVGGPVIRYVADDADVSPALRAFAEQARLSSNAVTMLASIRWRDGEQPRTTERWEYVYRSLQMSRDIDTERDRSSDAENDNELDKGTR
jgi:transcriptional regulator with XRE-family HTH domain